MHLNKLVALTLLYGTLCYGKDVSPISTASHVILGDVLGSEVNFAGGLIPITETKILVQKIYKNINNKVLVNDTISVINYGGFINENEYFVEGEDPFYISKNRKVILCLKKYFNHYKFERPSDFESVSYVVNNKVYAYDTLSLKDSTSSSSYNKNIANSNIHRRKEILSDFEGNKSQSSLLYTGIVLNDYVSKYIEEKIANSDVECCKNAPIVLQVSVLSIDKETYGPYHHTYKFRINKIIKGSLGDKSIKEDLTMNIPAHGSILPEIKEKGYLLLNAPNQVFSTENFFLKISNGKLINSNNRTELFLKKYIDRWSKQ